MGNKSRYKSSSIFDMQFITSSISTTLVLLLLGLVVFFVLTAHNLSVYVRENISFSILISDDMKEADILNAEAFLCRLGAQATGKKQVAAEDGIVEIMQLIRQLGHNPKEYKIADGCGLSNYNYLSPALLVDFLKYAYSRTEVFRICLLYTSDAADD